MQNQGEFVPHSIDPFRRFLLGIVGVDLALIAVCPQRDVSAICAKVLLLLLATVFLSAEISLILHQIYGNDGSIRLDLVGGSAFIAVIVGGLDAYIFLRGSFLPAGMAELRRAGLHFGSVAGDLARKIASMAVRVLLSAVIAILTSIGACLIIYGPEISSQLDRAYRTENASLIAAATRQADDRLQRATDSVKQQEIYVAHLHDQLIARRDNAASAATDSSVEAQQRIINLATLAKQQRDAELVASQTRAADELAGIKGEDSSGVPGRGPRRLAAEERVRQTQAAADAAAKALADEQARLDELRNRVAAASGDRAKQAQAQLPQLEGDLARENARLEEMRADLKRQVEHRDAAINAAVDNAPDHVRRNKGLLTQLAALRQIAAQNPEVEIVILLIDLAAMALEGSFVIATSVAYVPTDYSVLLAHDHLLRVNGIADELAAKLGPPEPEASTAPDIVFVPEEVTIVAANDNDIDALVYPEVDFAADESPFDEPEDVPPDPPKRGRGRPRKTRLN